jgi:hypothetical protein
MSDKYIIPKQTPQVVNSYNYKYPAGVVNTLERRTLVKHLCIDSLFRKNYNSTLSSNFSYILTEPINNVVSMNVSAIEFPNAWYTFSGENHSNEFTITIYHAPTPPDNTSLVYPPVMTHLIKIPDGNYRSDILRDAMNNMFSNIRGGLEYIYFDINEVNTHCVFRTKALGDDKKEALLVDSTLAPGSFRFTIDFTVEADRNRPLYKNAGWMLGFRNKTYEAIALSDPVIIKTESSFSTQIFHWYIESESSYGSSVQNYIFLDIDDHNKNFNSSNFAINSEDSNLGNNVIGRISVSSGMNTTITNTANDFVFKRRDYFGPIKLERIHIRLINKLGEPIALNGNDYSFVLEIEQLYS